MTKLNPYTNKPTRFITKEEIESIPINTEFVESTFEQIDEQIRCSFEFAAQYLVRSQENILAPDKAAAFDDLHNRIPDYDDAEANFTFWVSELIQNAHDATWLEGNKNIGPTVFEFFCNEDSFTFAHDGRPPQWVSYAQNEVVKMTKFSTSKHNHYTTEGQFGIGFKIWLLMFKTIELRYGHCELKIEINQTERHAFPEFRMTWHDDPAPKFSIRASQPHEEVGKILETLSEKKLDEIYQRSLEGLLMRPYPFRMTVHTPNYHDVVKKVEETSIPSRLRDDGFKCWCIEADEGHGLPAKVLTFTQPIKALQYSEERLVNTLKNEIQADRKRAELFQKDKMNDDVDNVVNNTLQAFDATITVIAEQGFEGAIYNSLFPIPGTDKENLTTKGLHFVAKFAMDERRENLADDHYKKERNKTLMMSLLECFFQMMDGLKEHESRNSLGITDQAYYRLLGVFSDIQSNDDGINRFVEEIQELLAQPNYSTEMVGIFELLEVYPLLEDGAYSNYLNLKLLRTEVILLLEDEDEELQNWGKSVLDPMEGICLRGNGEFEYYSWEVDAWSHILRPYEALWEQHGGPEDMDAETILGHIDRMDDFGCPDWLKIPMKRESEQGIEWFTLEELDGHLISRKSMEEPIELCEFETAIRSGLVNLNVDELFIDSGWETLLKSQNNDVYSLIHDKIVSPDSLYTERVRLLIENSDDSGRAFFLNLVEQKPQDEAKFPFLLITEINQRKEVVKLDKAIPESVLFSDSETSRVVTCEKSSSHWKILDTMNCVATVLGRNDRPTHIFVDQYADQIIQDISNINILPQTTIAVENIPRSAEIFSGLNCNIPTLTCDDVRDTVLSWVNKIPHVGVPLKIEPQHFSDVFEAHIPTNLRNGEGSNDQYIVVEDPSHELKWGDIASQRKKNYLHDTTANYLLDTNYWREGSFDKSKDKKSHWEGAMKEGRFAILLRVSSYPSVIAENLIEDPTKENYLRYLRSLRFSHMDINPSFFFIHLGDLFIPKSSNRRIRIVCKKFTAAELCALEMGNSIMTYLGQNKAYVGCLSKSPTEKLSHMFRVTPSYATQPQRNNAAAEWNLVPGRLSSMVFRHALLHKMALLPDTILLKNAPYFEENPVLAQEAVDLLHRLDHQLMDLGEFPLKEGELFSHFFSYVPGRSEKPILLRELIESIGLKDEEFNQEPNVLLAHCVEALVLSQHQFLNMIDETSHDHYWRDLAAIEFENYKSDDVIWSDRFEQLLVHRKQFTANTIKFIHQLSGLTDFSTVLRRLKDNGEKARRRKCGKTLQRENLRITTQTQVYILLEDEYDSCFPLATKSTWLSEHSHIYSSPASIVLTATSTESSSIKEKFPDELSQHTIGQRILNEVQTILNEFLEVLLHGEQVEERNDATNEEQRRAVEFLRRGVLRYLADTYSPVESGIPTGDLLNRAYNSIDVRTVSAEQANSQSMFPASDDELLSNILIGPCGIGWSLEDGRLTMTLGPWLNRDWGREKLNWAKDLFGELLDGFSLKKRDFEDKYGIPNDQLNFLSSQGYISGFDQTTHWLRTHQDGLLPIDTAFEDFLTKGEWQDVNAIESLIEQILDKIKRESSEGRLQEAAPSVFEKMYPQDLICTISGYVMPDPIGSSRLHTVRLRRPDTATHQPVLDEPTRPNLRGWESIGNTLYVSDRASQTGQRLNGWRLRSPHGEVGSFVEHLASNIERYYVDSSDEFIRIPDVVYFRHEDGHNDAQFDLQLHKLHSLYIIAYDKYCQGME